MLFVLLAVFIFGMDLLFKDYVEKHVKLKEERKIFGGKLLLTKHHNYGVLLNHFEGQSRIIRVVSSAVFILACLMFSLVLPKKRAFLWKLSLSFLVGGGGSNLFDRMKKGYVIDYFCLLGRTPKCFQNIVFNLGDVFIFAGCLLIFIKELFSDEAADGFI